VPAVSVRLFKAACGFPEDAQGRSRGSPRARAYGACRRPDEEALQHRLCFFGNTAARYAYGTLTVRVYAAPSFRAIDFLERPGVRRSYSRMDRFVK
jgi:hypothetical protein